MPPLVKYYALIVLGGLLTTLGPIWAADSVIGWIAFAAGFIPLFAAIAIRCPRCSNRIGAPPLEGGGFGKIWVDPQKCCRFCGHSLLGENEEQPPQITS
jgi:hypothetical protein